MDIKDIHEINQEYKEINRYRAYLYTPNDTFAGELDLLSPVLSLNKNGFNTLTFNLAPRYFDQLTLNLQKNEFIDKTLDGYFIIFQYGELEENDYEEMRFIVKNRNSNLSDEKATFSYTAISAEYELQKLPIINWPGILVREYKQITNPIPSEIQVEGVAHPKLLNDSPGTYAPIALSYVPKDGKIWVSRVHTTYGVEVPLFETSQADSTLEKMEINEYYYDSSNNQVIAWVPAHLSLPVDNLGNTNFNDPVDSYQYYIYYETKQQITLNNSFEKSFYYKQDGLTINEVVEDLFNNLEDQNNSSQHFIQWAYDINESIKISDSPIRSGLSFNNTNVYDILKKLEESYQLYIDFDTINRKVIIKQRSFGENRGLRFEYGKYLKGITQDYVTDNVINYIQGQDKNKVGFARVS